MSDQRRKALKAILRLMCQLLWVLGSAVGLSGVYLLMNYRQSSSFFSHNYIILPAVLTIASTVFLVACGCLGTWLSFRDSTCLQGLFVYMLVVAICVESTAAALAYFHSTELESEITPLSEVFRTYTGNSHDPNSRAVDATQRELKCCGVHDYKDWLHTSWFNHTGGLMVPHSCCNSTFPSCIGSVTQPQQLYTKGCQVKLEMAFQFLLSYIMWGFVALFMMEVFLLLTVAQLMMNRPFVAYQILDKNHRRCRRWESIVKIY